MNITVLAALQIFNYGLIPIPLIGKRPVIKDWPRRFKEQPLTPDQINNGILDEGRKITYDNKNVGILTGEISNIIVVDIDNLELLSKLKEYGELPLTYVVKTSRGLHLYFRYTDKITSTRIWNGIDILSDKKIVVAPPSIHPSGVKYQWIHSPKDVELAELPTWLTSLIKNNNSSTLYKTSKISKRENDHLDMANNDWLEFYSRHLKNIKGSGLWHNARCPFHDDHQNSFAFNIENGGWVCFARCGKGNGLQFIKKIYNVSLLEALDLIRGRDIYA